MKTKKLLRSSLTKVRCDYCRYRNEPDFACGYYRNSWNHKKRMKTLFWETFVWKQQKPWKDKSYDQLYRIRKNNGRCKFTYRSA